MKGIQIIFCFLFGIVLVSSCIEEQNFDQFDALTVEPEYEASIIYVEAPEALVNAVAASNFYAQDFNFDAFSENVFADRVIEGSVTYLVDNTTSKALELTVQFLNEANEVLDTEIFMIDEGPTAVLEREVFYGDGGKPIEIIRNTSSIRVSAANLGDDVSTSDLPDPKIILRSSGKFRVRLR
ncbi:hypothetical protein [Maribacter sp. 2-571]|uniref:hypothetical protein n=1 Tax=Maribacter sp. 2-571 TaxID=3417569 RepID=UPI003D349F09